MFETTNIQQVAYLIAAGYQPANVTGPSHRKVFTFSNVPEDVPARFLRDANVQKLFEAYAVAKRLVHQKSA